MTTESMRGPLPASSACAGSAFRGPELTADEAHTLVWRRRKARTALIALVVSIPVALSLVVSTAAQPRIDPRVQPLTNRSSPP